MWMHVVFGFLLAISIQCHPYEHLDQDDDKHLVRTCEIEGFVHRTTFELHGSLYNCMAPAMNCTIESHEPLDKKRRNIECRVPNNGWFYYDDYCCGFRFYYRKQYCNDELLCYNIAINCDPVPSPKPFFYISIVLGVILILLLIAFVAYYIWDTYYRVGDTQIGNRNNSKRIPNESDTQEMNYEFGPEDS